MANQLGYAGKVVVVTGAGGGLGKAYALLFGLRGAKVVVNDLGGNPRGDGSDKRAADMVVNEIRNHGGTAVADYNSVEDGAKVIQSALDNFGRIDVLVNNAGILRDRSFVRTSDADWDSVHSVHLRGSFMTTRAAFPVMKAQKYGKIIMTSSTSGIYGNFGQANYSAAKLGLLGLSNTVAIEGQKYNISCNTVVPTGGTRMTEGILPPDLFAQLKPEFIAPLVLWLCHENCDENGGVFEAAGGWYGKYRWERSKGVTCRGTLSEMVSPEAVRDNWEKITDFEESDHFTSNAEAGGKLAMVLEDLREKSAKIGSSLTSSGGRSVTGPLSAVGASKTCSYTFEPKDAILYALGVGISTKDTNGLQYLYEGHEDFSPLPTFVVIPAMAAMMGSSLLTELPGWNVDVTKILHGEQYIEFLKPLPPSGTLKSKALVTDVMDKGSGAVVLTDVTTSDSDGIPLARSQFSVFVVGAGDFGGPRKSERMIPLVNPPPRHPDAVRTFTTSVDQAALYRLSGDFNPLHIEPSFAAMGGFEQPILHGLSSFGISAKAVLDEYCEGDVTKFKAIKVRFSSPVIPGQSLVTSMWKEGNRIIFETHVKETAKICLIGGYVDLISGSSAGGLTSNDIFSNLAQKVVDVPNIVKGALRESLIVWNVLKDGIADQQWSMEFQLYPFKIYSGLPRVNLLPTVTITLEGGVLLQIANGLLGVQAALDEKKIRVQGKTNLAMPIFDFIRPQSKL